MSVNIKINNIKSIVSRNTTILQACDFLNIKIPRFCFHENLSIAGNCRMCLLEVKKNIKPIAACSMPVINDMEIYTHTPLAKKARENVLEFLLINHPLDCPICDQGGECDLQDQTLLYGSDKSRFFFNKRGVEDKNYGVFIKMIMTRCIHCTRCVRFATEVCGIDQLGTTGRGYNTEISFYNNTKKFFQSNFSGNLIDLCPVGALTSKTTAMQYRSWELHKNEMIDIFDTFNGTISIHTHNDKIIRVLPVNHELFNIDWISNQTRFFFDSLKYQRILSPMIKTPTTTLMPINWITSFLNIFRQFQQIDNSQTQVFLGAGIDLKSMFWLKKLCSKIGISRINYITKNTNTINIKTNIVNQYISTSFSNKLENAEICLLINMNSSLKNSIFNLYLKQLEKTNNLQIYNIGKINNLFATEKNLSFGPRTIQEILTGKHSLCKKLIKKRFLIITNEHDYSLISKITTLPLILNNLNIIYSTSGFVNFLEIFNFKSLIKNNSLKLIFLYNTYNEYNSYQTSINENPYIVYLGHHYTLDAKNADLILPCTTFVEKSFNFITTFGLIYNYKLILKKLKSVYFDFYIFQSLYIFFEKYYTKIYSKSLEFNYITIYNNKTTTHSLQYVLDLTKIKNKTINRLIIGKKIINNLLIQPIETNVLLKFSKNLIKSEKLKQQFLKFKK